MSVSILIDMNLSPDWCNVFSQHGWSSVHWSTMGGRRCVSPSAIFGVTFRDLRRGLAEIESRKVRLQ